MIAGVGVDVVDIARMRSLYQRFGDRLVARLLAASERAQCKATADPARLIAKRFAVKEAAAKALGTGIAQGVRFGDFATAHGPAGEPRLELAGRALEIARARGVVRSHLSLSDERRTVVAFVVLEGAGPGA